MSFRTRIASIGRLLRLQWAVSKSAFLLSMLATVLAGIAPPVEAYVLKKVIDVCLAQAGAGLVWTEAVLAVLPWLLLMAGSALAMSVVNLLSFKMNELSGRLVTERLICRCATRCSASGCRCLTNRNIWICMSAPRRRSTAA